MGKTLFFSAFYASSVMQFVLIYISAYGIAVMAIKTCVDQDDQRIMTDFDLTVVRRKIKEYFKV